MSDFVRANNARPISLDEFLPFLPEEAVLAAAARFIHSDVRPVLYRTSLWHSSFGQEMDILFLPTTFSEEFRRFMRGEPISRSEPPE